jgi:hypothetical protein
LDEAELVSEINQCGYEITSVYDLVNTNAKYDNILPILVKHLKMKHHDRIKEGLARALTVRSARPWWEDIKEEYIREKSVSVYGSKAALGNTLSVLATKEHVSDLIELATDECHGDSRALIIDGLGRFAEKRVRDALKSMSLEKSINIAPFVKKSLDKVNKKMKKKEVNKKIRSRSDPI